MAIIYCIQENIRGGKLLHFKWKIPIHGNAFAVAFLQTYTADRQGHYLQENIGG